MLFQNPTHSRAIWSHKWTSPSSVSGIWILLLLSNEPIKPLSQKWGWSNLGSNHSSKINVSSKRRLLWTTAVFQNKGVVREGRGGLFCLSLFSWIENYWLPPVHQSASRVWTLNYSKGMNELIYSRYTHAEHKRDPGDTPAGKMSFHNPHGLKGECSSCIFFKRGDKRICDKKLIWVEGSNIHNEYFS